MHLNLEECRLLRPAKTFNQKAIDDMEPGICFVPVDMFVTNLLSDFGEIPSTFFKGHVRVQLHNHVQIKPLGYVFYNAGSRHALVWDLVGSLTS
jgi:hypothetical protein